jgi:hypothetical protein
LQEHFSAFECLEPSQHREIPAETLPFEIRFPLPFDLSVRDERRLHRFRRH